MFTDSYLKKIAKGAGFIFLGLIFSKIVSYGFRVIIARKLGTQSYGIFNLGIAITGILGVIALFGLNEGVVRYLAYYKGKEDKKRIKGTFFSAIIISIISSIILAVLLFISSGFIAETFFSDPNLTYVLKLFSLAIPLSVLSRIFIDTLRANQKIKYIIYAEHITSTLTKFLLAIITISLGFGLIGVIWAYIVAITVSLLLSLYYIKTKVKTIMDTNIKSKLILKKLFTFSWPLLLTTLLFFLMSWIDTLMIGYFKTSHFVGIYNSAVPTASLVRVFPIALIYLFLPIVAYFVSKNDQKEIKSVFNTVTRWIFITNLPLTILLMVFSKQMINFFFGQEYISAALPLLILALGQFFYISFLTCVETLKSIKKTKFILYVNIFSTLFNIGFNWYLIPLYGLVGAAIATTSAFLFRGLLLFIGSYNYMKLLPLRLEYIKPTIIMAILCSPLIYLSYMYNISFYLVIILSLLFLSFYAASLLLFKILKKEDYMILKTIKNRIN